MRLPCDRYIRFQALRGVPILVLLDLLARIGYAGATRKADPKTGKAVASVPLLGAALNAVVGEVAEVSRTSPVVTNDILAAWQLVTAWKSNDLLREVEYILDHPELRRFIEMTIIAGAAPVDVCRIARERQNLRIAPEIVALYQHLLMDLSSMQSWEIDLAFTWHSDGEYYRSVRMIGTEGMSFYTGEEVTFDAERAAEFIAQGSYIKVRELLLSPGTSASIATQVARYVSAMESAFRMMGPAKSLVRLRKALEDIAIAVAPLPAERLRPGMDVTGIQGARVAQADINHLIELVKLHFQENLKLLPEPGTEPKATED